MMNGTLNSRTKFTLGALALLMSLGSVPAMAQQQRQQAAGQGVNALPPALHAAVMSGNANQIRMAINTLSAGNAEQAASLASRVITAAESMLSVNPVAAVAAAQAAVGVFSQPAVAQTNPASALQTAATAARIMMSPAVQQTSPAAAGALSVAVLSLVANPAVYGANPQAAVLVARDAYQVATSPAVTAANPNVAQQAVQILSQMSQSQQLSALNPNNAAQLQAVLANRNPDNDNGPIGSGSSQINSSVPGATNGGGSGNTLPVEQPPLSGSPS